MNLIWKFAVINVIVVTILLISTTKTSTSSSIEIIIFMVFAILISPRLKDWQSIFRGVFLTENIGLCEKETY